MTIKIFTLNERIEVSGKATTIQEQWQAGKAREMSTDDEAKLSNGPRRYWVEIEGDDTQRSYRFDISEAGFLSMREKNTNYVDFDFVDMTSDR